MSLKIEKLKIEEIKIHKTPELEAVVKLMEKHGTTDGYNLLPKSTKHHVSMQLDNTYSAFANAIRRTLVEDIPTYSLLVDEKDIITDDEFIAGMSDVLIKNIGLVPIMQSGAIIDNQDKYDIHLDVFNKSSEIIDVKVRDLVIAIKKTRGGADSTLDINIEDELDESIEEVKTYKVKDTKKSNMQEIDINKLTPDSNILLMRLRPGKYLKIRNINIQVGTSAVDAGKYSLLNNISYEPLGVEPYDQFTGKGTRSIDHDYSSFVIKFNTCGNISPKEVMQRVHHKLTSDLVDLKKKIQLYVDAGSGSYYSGQDCEVTLTDEVYNFKLIGHYISELYMIAMCCYKLDENIPFCAATVERYDSIVGLLRIKHADYTKILMKAIDTCQKDLDKVLSVF
jgi:hypothetical protein